LSFKYIFGPINSRRFGISLGVDLSPDKKSCNFDCLYCELAASNLSDRIEDEANPKEIVLELKEALKEFKDIDVITITANGEPTLYSQLDELIDLVDDIKGRYKTLILSNASTIYKKDIQNTLLKFDIVKLSLDSANKRTFKKLDRNMAGIELKYIIDGIKSFRTQYRGYLVIEILVVKGLNDSKEEMIELDRALKEINPDRVDLSTIDRPPAYMVEGVSQERLRELSESFKNISVNVVYKNRPKNRLSYSKDEILHTIKLRPFSQFDVEYLLDDSSKDILEELVDDKKVVVKDIAGVEFYKLVDDKS